MLIHFVLLDRGGEELVREFETSTSNATKALGNDLYWLGSNRDNVLSATISDNKGILVDFSKSRDVCPGCPLREQCGGHCPQG